MSRLLTSYPRAILHIDGDSFFASCEIAVNPELRGKPVVTGKERGIASSMTYDLKAMGVNRGMSLYEIKKICPEVIIVPSDYETYSLFSMRMYEIVRRYTPAIEEYSIDECFADITGMRRPHKMSYEAIAERIKHELDTELGITFSIGLAPNKVLAKVASKWNKPSGLTLIPGRSIETFLHELSVGKIWGIGSQTSAYLNAQGIYTALQYAEKSLEWIDAHMSKPYKEIYEELRGDFVYPLTIGQKHEYQSISKTKTFTPPSSNREHVFSQLCKNIENACIKARRHELAPKKFFYFLKTQDFRTSGLEFSLTVARSAPHELIRITRESFDRVFKKNTLYRGTGTVLMNLEPERELQLDLFGSVENISNWKPVYDVVDTIDRKFGKHTLYLGSTSTALHTSAHLEERGDVPVRTKNLLKGESVRQRIGIPMLGEVT